MNQPVISVRGEASIEVDPDRASLTVHLTFRERKRTDALQRLQQHTERVGRVLDAFGDAIDGRGTETLQVFPVYESARSRDKVVGFRASTRTTVHVGDLSVLADVISQLSALGLTDLSGPWWSLRPDSPAFGEARKAAVHDAVRRARDYAAALQTDLEGLLEVADTGLLSRAAEVERVTPPRVVAKPTFGSEPGQAGAGGEAPPPAEFELEPVRQRVRASVDARFLARPPDLRGV